VPQSLTLHDPVRAGKEEQECFRFHPVSFGVFPRQEFHVCCGWAFWSIVEQGIPCRVLLRLVPSPQPKQRLLNQAQSEQQDDRDGPIASPGRVVLDSFPAEGRMGTELLCKILSCSTLLPLLPPTAHNNFI